MKKLTNQILLSSFSLFLLGAPFAVQAQNAEEASKLKMSIGAGVSWDHRYSGSKDHRTRAIPLISLSYDRYFFGGGPVAGTPAFAGGAKLLDLGAVTAGVFLATDLGKVRKESDNPLFQGLGDIKGTTWAGGYLKYQQDWLLLGAAIRQDIGGNDQGTVVNLAAEATYKANDTISFSAGPRLQIANRKHLNTLYGVNAEQSAITGLTPYDAKGGLQHYGVGFGLRYTPDKNWFANINVVARKLSGDAADGPFVQKKSQNSVAAVVGYRF